MICLKTSPTPMDLTPGFLFNSISLQLVSALTDFGSTTVDTSVLAKTTVCCLNSFYSVAYDKTDQHQDEMAIL